MWFTNVYPLEQFIKDFDLTLLPGEVVQTRYEILIATWQERVLLDVVASFPVADQKQLSDAVSFRSLDVLQEVLAARYPDIMDSFEGYARQVLDGYIDLFRRS